jgi:ferredoxin
MTWVNTRLCRDCLDTSCIEVSPVDCINEYVGPASDQYPIQLYIDPDECIDCQACEPGCPWEAPLRDTEVPPVFNDDTALNASTSTTRTSSGCLGTPTSPSDYQDRRLLPQDPDLGTGQPSQHLGPSRQGHQLTVHGAVRVTGLSSIASSRPPATPGTRTPRRGSGGSPGVPLARR